MKAVCNKANPPLSGYLALEYYRSTGKDVHVTWDAESSVTAGSNAKPVPYGTSNDLIRIVENAFNKGSGPLQRVTMNHWLSFSLILEDEMPKSLDYLDKTLGPLTYLIGESLSVSDLAVFGVLYVSGKFKQLAQNNAYNNIARWMKLVQAQPAVAQALKSLPADVLQALSKSSSRSSRATNNDATSGRQQEGKFVDLPHAEMGKVVVRFPPEASGYLHIGHAKAALLNQYYQQAFDGKLIMRFDDTNPAKENVEFEKVILGDVEMLEIKPDLFTHTSQYFDLMLESCERLIREGKAYVDDTPHEQMKSEREQKVESRNRGNSVEKNLQLWAEMKRASALGVQCCVRAKIDMSSPNGCMRDPTVYRCKPEPHPRTGTQYNVYPTYDFACPIVDSVEGVTHVLRTMEYHDRDPQFYWFIDALGLRKPYIWEYSRLSMTNTVLSKRKLTWFVEQGLVDGWDDPRMPTVRGVLRRGMTVEGLRQFIQAQGSSRSVVFMEWDKIWAINKKVIDPIAPRYTTLEKDPVTVNLRGVEEATIKVDLHPKNPQIGTKEVCVGPKLLIDQVDARLLKEGENATFVAYGNVMIDKIHRAPDGAVTSVDATPNLDNKDYKKTVKLTWLVDSPRSPPVETYCVYFDHIISKTVLGKDEDFKKYIGHPTRWEVPMLGEAALGAARRGDVVQLQRRGFFRVDVAAAAAPSALSSRRGPLVLFHVPDGHTKEMPGQPKPAQAAKQASPAPVAAAAAAAAPAPPQLDQQIAQQGDAVRALKTAKADKASVDAAVKLLLELKAKYKAATGQDWKPGAVPAAPAAAAAPAAELEQRVARQGEAVRALKAAKADKAAVDAAVKQLLDLKAQYKAATGKDWKPAPAAPAPAAPAAAPAAPAAAPAAPAAAHAAVAAQGEKVRRLKAEKAGKAAIDAEVKHLLSLKAEYKALTGSEWSPTAAPAEPRAPAAGGLTPAALETNRRITEQGDRVRALKEQKADKAAVTAEVQTLLALKADFKKETGQDWTPNMVKESSAAPAPASAPASAPAPAPAPAMSGAGEAALAASVAAQGDLVRDLKTKKADKAAVDAAVKKLLELKAQYQAETGKAYAPPAQGPAKPRDNKPKDSKPKEDKPKDSKPKENKQKENKPKENKPKDVKAKDAKKEQSPKPAEAAGGGASGPKKVTRLGLEARKDADLSEWYTQVITKAEMIEYYDISGCYILRPWSFSIWEYIRDFLSAHFKALGVKDCYFPIFVSKSALEREKAHIADFAPEVAWVTHSGDAPLAEHIAVRPTSETAMYPAYAKWVQSHRDLPLRLNQWNNVVRWEFKQPQPFLRTREFLWQEGHTAFQTKREADEEVLTILDLYARVYEELLAIPVVKGRKTEKEKFAGSAYTTTVEAFVPASGRGIQGATSHHLGQNFSRMFDIVFDDPETQEKTHVYQNSWGLTTRTIGVMILVHGDDRGLVLPPRVAAVQAVVVPCGVTASSSPEERAALTDACRSLVEELRAGGVRAEGDYRDNYSPGWKFNHWELKGVPVRVELGPKDLAAGAAVAVQRLTGARRVCARAAVAADVAALLEDTHREMLARATADRDARLSHVTEWRDFTAALERRHILMAPFCGAVACEDNIKADSARTEDDSTTEVKAPAMGAKSLCIPFQQPRELTASDRCIHPACNNKPTCITLFGRSY